MSATERTRGANRAAKTRRARNGARLSVVCPTPTVRAARRGRIEAALERCATRDRLVLALMLLEHLSPSEAADALGISVDRLRRTYDATLESLRRAMLDPRATATPRSRRRSAAGEARLRKAV